MNELYDLDADPYEERNVAADPGAVELLGRMQAELQKLQRSTDAAVAASAQEADVLPGSTLSGKHHAHGALVANLRNSL